MKKTLLLIVCALVSWPIYSMDATMYGWKSYLAYGTVDQVVDAGNVIYGLASGSLYSVNKKTEEIVTYSKQTGMNGGEIAAIAWDEVSQTLVLAYADGLIDLFRNGQFSAMTDLQQKSMTVSKRANKIVMEQGIAYFCMRFGIMAVDVAKRQIKDTYYIGNNGSDVDVIDLAFASDSLHAISSSVRYSVARSANWMDFTNWKQTLDFAVGNLLHAIVYWQNNLLILVDNTLMQRKGNSWSCPCSEWSVRGISSATSDKLFVITSGGEGLHYLDSSFRPQVVSSVYSPLSIAADGAMYWLGTEEDGIVKQTATQTQSFAVNGPAVNIPYRLKIVNDKLYMLAGQRWLAQTNLDADIMLLDLNTEVWTNISHKKVDEQAGTHIHDLMNVAVDPSNAEHFYVSSFGCGVIECQGTDVVAHYIDGNSPLVSAVPGNPDYTRTDGVLFDKDGNLWMLNANVENLIHIASPEQQTLSRQTGKGQWFYMPLKTSSKVNIITTPNELFVDNRHSNWKWIPSCITDKKYGSAGLFLLDDNNTPQYSGDDVVVEHTSFEDQDGNTVTPGFVKSVAQDKNGAIWLGMNTGLLVIPSNIDCKQSNRCERIKVPRNDGSGLADYLLDTEEIKAIAVDGANRKWIGTEASGLYLVSEDGLETIYHFTTDNSPLIDNAIYSIAIHPSTGRVYIGTKSGLLSYQSDAATPAEEYSNVYAYPNPVRPEYEGVVTICGLKDESIVHIVDNAGNLVCETRSNGGIAIWDGKTANGCRAASGVYTVFLNENNGGSHAVTKILLMH